MKRRYTALQTSALAALVAALGGCQSTTFVDEERNTQATGSLKAGESVVILRKNQRAASKTEGDFVDCVAETLESEDYKVDVLAEQTFVDSLYPYFETSSAPTSVQALSDLHKEPAAAEQLSQLEARYIVWMRGNTETVDRSGSFTCSIGPGGGGCFGFASWTNQGSYKADVWDVKKQAEAGTIDVESEGTSHLVGAVVPIPLLAGVEDEACDALAGKIANFVKGNRRSIRQAGSDG